MADDVSAAPDDDELMSNTQIEEVLVGQQADVQAEIVRINTDARPLALQIALVVPLLAALAGLFNAFRMTRLPEPDPSGSIEGMAFGSVLYMTMVSSAIPSECSRSSRVPTFRS